MKCGEETELVIRVPWFSSRQVPWFSSRKVKRMNLALSLSASVQSGSPQTRRQKEHTYDQQKNTDHSSRFHGLLSMTPDPSRPFAHRDVGESSREWRWRVGTLRPDARCADHDGWHEQQQGRRCQKTRRGAPWSRLQSQALGARAAPMLGPVGTKSETLLAAPSVVTARTIMSHDGKLATGQSCGAGVFQKKTVRCRKLALWANAR